MKTNNITPHTYLPHLNFLRPKKQEYFVCLSLDANCRIIRRHIVAMGLLDSVQTHPREVFAPVIVDRAAFILVAHNHPSGEAKPSRHDIQTTQQLIAAGILLGVPLHDHIIVAGADNNRHFSFRRSRLL